MIQLPLGKILSLLIDIGPFLKIVFYLLVPLYDILQSRQGINRVNAQVVSNTFICLH
jgi:hypothetical protein